MAKTKLAEAVVFLRTDRSLLQRDLKTSERLMQTSVTRMATAASRMFTSKMRAAGTMARGFLKAVFSPTGLITGALSSMLFRRFISPFATFEEQMDKSLAIMKGAIGREQELEKTAREAAKAFGRSHKSMAEAFFFLASAGLDAERSLAAYNKLTVFATAGSFDMASATDMLTDSLSALGLASEDAEEYGRNMERLSDLIVKGNTLANTSVSQLAEAIMRKGGTAMKLFRMEVEDGISVLLSMADTGFAKGSMAGTQFFLMMIGLTQAWRKHGDVMRKHGITVFEESTGELRKMSDIMREFVAIQAGMTTEAFTEFISGTLAIGTRPAAVLAAVMGQHELMERNRKELETESAGTSQRIAERVSDNLMTQWNRFKADVVDATISINQALVPLYRSILGLGGAFVDKIREMADAAKNSKLSKFFGDMKEKVDDLAKVIRATPVGNIFAKFGETIVMAFGLAADLLIESAKLAGEAFGKAAAKAATETVPKQLKEPMKQAGGGLASFSAMRFAEIHEAAAWFLGIPSDPSWREWANEIDNVRKGTGTPFGRAKGSRNKGLSALRDTMGAFTSNIQDIWDTPGAGVSRGPGISPRDFARKGGGPLGGGPFVPGALTEFQIAQQVQRMTHELSRQSQMPTGMARQFINRQQAMRDRENRDEERRMLAEWVADPNASLAEQRRRFGLVRESDILGREIAKGEEPEKRAERAWAKAGVAEMHQTIQEAIFKSEDKKKEQVQENIRDNTRMLVDQQKVVGDLIRKGLDELSASREQQTAFADDMEEE